MIQFNQARRIAGIALMTVGFGVGCANPAEVESTKDAGTPAIDAGVSPDASIPSTHVLEQSNLAPATEAANAGPYRIRGHLRSSEVRPASTSTHQIRGGFVPLTR